MAAAYHEAGHVVACFLLKRRFRYATIEPDEDSLGHVLETRLPVSFRPDIDSGPRARAVTEKIIVSLFAGEAAEAAGEADTTGAVRLPTTTRWRS
jgi:hypothetical protein